MKVLFVSAVLPYPLYSGGQVRIYNLLKQLSHKHEIHLFSFIRNDSENALLGNLSFCKKITTILRGRAWQPKYILKSLMSRESFLYATYDNEEMKSRISTELSSGAYDVLHVEPSYVWECIPATTVPIVVSEHNIEHEIYSTYSEHISFAPLRPLLNWDVQKMIRSEKIIWKQASEIVSVSKEDADYIRKEGDNSAVTVVPNGVDISYFAYKPKMLPHRGNPIFLYVGTFAWLQNVDAVQYVLGDIWSKIRMQYPEATLRIVGKNPPKSITQTTCPGILFVESVDDIRQEYYGADILLAPIRIGGGTKYKILESMACGLPVLTTTKGVQGFEFESGKEVWIADSPDDFVKQSRDIIENTDRDIVLQRARTHVETSFSWTGISEIQSGVWSKAYETKKR